MATWKKVIVSGSSAALAALQVDNLTSGSVVIGGGSTSNLSVTAINGTGNIVATTNATGLVHTGSFTGSFTGAITGTSSFATSASYAFQATSASYAQQATTASYSLVATSASYAQQATTASYALNATSASYANTSTAAATASYVNALSQVVRITGSLDVSGSILATAITSSFTGSLVGALTGTASFATSASYAFQATSASYSNTSTAAATASYVNILSQAVKITGSLDITGSILATTITSSFSGNLTGTASFATSASYAFQATSASYAQQATTASYALVATSASFASTAAQVNNALTFGTGLSGSTSTYNGSTAVNVAISGSVLLTSNLIPKWTGTGLVNSNITDSGTQVQIGAGASSGVSIAAGGINVTGNSTFNNNLTISGDLTVNGTASFVNSDNLYVKDKFILINSGSNTLADSGIVVQYSTGSGTGASGSAIFLEAGSTGTYGRWAVAYDILGSATSVTADEYMVSAKIGQASAPGATNPTWGSNTNGMGNMWVTTGGDIYIYS